MTKKQKEKLLLALIRALHEKFVMRIPDLKPEHIVNVKTFFQASKGRTLAVEIHFDSDALKIQAELDSMHFSPHHIDDLQGDLSVDNIIRYCHIPCALTQTYDVKFWLAKDGKKFTLTNYILWIANSYMKLEAKTLREVELQLALQGLLANDVSA